MQEKELLLHLFLTNGIGPAIIELLLQKKELLKNLYSFSTSDVAFYFNITQAAAQKIVIGLKDTKKLEQELSLIQKHTIEYFSVLDEQYPELLKHIDRPPTILYVKGRIANEKAIAIIGARKANFYGQKVIEKIVPDLVGNGWTIVSGGAIGADTMAHKATLKNKGKTVAVIGSGLLQPYPFSNKRLFAQMIETGGAVISSFPLQTEPHPGNFPVRNRIIAGLAKGTVVVQAAHKSGAKITAEFALEQGKEVFAIPGSVEDPLSVGCHDLIGQGATLVKSAKDILQEFGEVPINKNKKDDQLPEPFKTIVQLCSEPCSVDFLIEKTEINLFQMQQLLFDLQLQGKLTQNLAGQWERA